MTTLASSQFQIERTLDLAADGFTVDVPGATAYLDADDADAVALAAGFLDPDTGDASTVAQLAGPVIEYGITVTPDSVTGSLSGRDAMADAQERRYQMRYLRQQPTPAEQTAMDGHLFNTVADPILYRVGEFRASDIARDVAEFCGLTLAWECRDYTLLEDFDASGRPVDILRTLVEPWSQVEPLKVDLFIEGETLILRPRSAAPRATDTFDRADAKIKNLGVRRRRADRTGRLTLQGRMVPKGLTGGGSTAYLATEVEETSTSETLDADQVVQQRVVRTTTYRLPERIILRYREQQYDRQAGALKLVKDDTRENEWEATQYDASGAQTQPKQLRATTYASGIYPKDKTFRVLKKEEVEFGYGDDGYQAVTLTRKWELKAEALQESERVVKTLKEAENLKTEEVTSVYKRAASGDFYLQTQESNVSAGLRPGGPRPGRTITIGVGGPLEPLTIEERMSSHVWAKDVTYHNPHLAQEDLDFIAGQFRSASGLWRYELSMQYVAMPWLRKGHVLEITGLKDAAGRAIPIGPALVTSQTLNYDEGSQSPQMVSSLQAVWWTA